MPPVPSDATGPADAPSLGRHIMVAFEDAPRGEPFVSESLAGGVVALRPVRRSVTTFPQGGEEVTCTSVAGTWTTTVRSCHDDVLELEAPAWLSRAVRRRWPREATSFAVTLSIGGTRWAGQLQDISLGGGAVMIEKAADLVAGATVEIALPAGTATAIVRSVRAHAHPLLAVVGLAWHRLDGIAQSWLGTQLAEGRSQRMRTGADS